MNGQLKFQIIARVPHDHCA